MSNLFDYRNVVKVNTFLLIMLLSSIAASLWTSFEVTKSNENRLLSLALADELQKSSDDLTRFARLYVVTGDANWEKEYNYVVEWREGQKARPDGKTVSLNEMFKKQGFTEHELKKLELANKLSGDLISTEVEAMHAVKGLYRDVNGGYKNKGVPNLEHARRLMHDQLYQNFLKEINKPITEFRSMLKTRLDQDVEKYNERIVVLQSVTIFIALLIFSLSLYSNSSLKKVLSVAVAKLTHSSKKISHVMQELQSTGESLASASTESSAATSETAAAVDETNSMIMSNKEVAVDTTQTTHKTKGNAEKGKNVVGQMEVLMKEINEANNQVADTVDSSNKRFNEIISMINTIREKTKVINDIVFQTRLLSFNASVEAARAGDQGKGFAVVAEEIGKLAEVSGKSATEISEILDKSVVDVEAIINETKVTVDRIIVAARGKTNNGVKIAVECSVVLDEIVSEVNRVVEMSEKISHASSEQANGMNEIAKAMGNIDQSTHETSALSRKVTDISDELNQEVQTISLMMVELEKLTASGKKAA